MTTADTGPVERLACKEPGCEGRVEANPKLYLSAWEDGTWTIAGVGDDNASITCDDSEHDNHTDLLHKGMSAFLEAVLPGTTWQGSKPDHPLGEDTVTLQVSSEVFRALHAQVPDLVRGAPTMMQGRLLA